MITTLLRRSLLDASKPATSINAVLFHQLAPAENFRVPAMGGLRVFSKMTFEKKKTSEEEKRSGVGGKADDQGNKGEQLIVSYWGVKPMKITKEDGTEWKWTCFRPWETYKADLTIDLKKHHVPSTLPDKLAYWMVKSLRWPTDLFFQRRYGCRAMMLETVAAVPGMVGGMLMHFKSLRRFEQSGGWIKALHYKKYLHY
ncbi:Alternative oxidase [Arabidopsis suecica]|uniref:Ubiquinol oxidase n=1 Tax=Arabidopsis suecica TaxID=45249 RepID=A0A8T1ZW76_ARASU|nr:Alternative oxidase [Arabidopsis suecica]